MGAGRSVQVLNSTQLSTWLNSTQLNSTQLNTLSARETGECFLEECPGNKRDRITLEALLVKRVRPGTKILTDGWAAYKGLEELGM